jgi:hypothetical protein
MITLICISLIPLPEKVKKFNTGYEEHIINTKTSHVLYPDDLKLIGDKEAERQTQLQTFKTFSDVINTNSDVTIVKNLYPRKAN